VTTCITSSHAQGQRQNQQPGIMLARTLPAGILIMTNSSLTQAALATTDIKLFTSILQNNTRLHQFLHTQL
jgi:hypothetical protein